MGRASRRRRGRRSRYFRPRDDHDARRGRRLRRRRRAGRRRAQRRRAPRAGRRRRRSRRSGLSPRRRRRRVLRRLGVPQRRRRLGDGRVRRVPRLAAADAHAPRRRRRVRALRGVDSPARGRGGRGVGVRVQPAARRRPGARAGDAARPVPRRAARAGTAAPRRAAGAGAASTPAATTRPTSPGWSPPAGPAPRSTSCCASRTSRRRCEPRDCSTVCAGAAAVVLAVDDVAARSALPPGMDHRDRPAHGHRRARRARPHGVGVDPIGGGAARTAGLDDRRARGARAVQPPGADRRRRHRRGRRSARSTRRAARCPPTR